MIRMLEIHGSCVTFVLSQQNCADCAAEDFEGDTPALGCDGTTPGQLALQVARSHQFHL